MDTPLLIIAVPSLDRILVKKMIRNMVKERIPLRIIHGID